MELPRHCLYWKDSRVTSVLAKYGFLDADFDGCQYGLVAKFGREKGHPICKPWRIATLRSTLPDYLCKVCSGSHALHHTRCGGANTKETQCYTPLIVNMLFKSVEFDNGELPMYIS